MLRLVGMALVAGGSALGAPTLLELRNATYAGLEDLAVPVTLEERRWEGEPFEPGAASRPSVVLAPGFRLTGDLDGDGAEEAVVVLAQSSGGSGTWPPPPWVTAWESARPASRAGCCS
jgi:hypothetical protein